MAATETSLVLVGILFVCYFFLIANRKSFQYVIPYVLEESWVTKTDIGFIISCQTFGYTISKFIGGMAADYLDNRVMLCSSTFLASVITLLFAFSTDVSLSAVMWFTSGAIQGVTWPAIAKILRKRIRSEDFGTCWVVISCSMNVASMIMPVISGFISQTYHWTYSLHLIALISFLYAAIPLMYFLWEDPTVEAEGSESKVDEDSVAIPWMNVIFDPIQLSLAFGYLVISILRYTATDWMPLYLIKEVNMPQMFASGFVSMMETGGIVGSLIAAKVSDLCIQKYNIHNNARVPCIVVFTMIAINALYLMCHIDASQKTFISVIAFVLGCSIYGPVSLYGVAAIESAPNRISGTCHTIVALAGNIGATLAGYPISVSTNVLGWTNTFYLIVVLLGLNAAALCYCFFRNVLPLKEKLKTE